MENPTQEQEVLRGSELDLERTREYIFPSGEEDVLNEYIKRVEADILEELKGKVIEHGGKKFICTSVSSDLRLRLEHPDTGEVIELPYAEPVE